MTDNRRTPMTCDEFQAALPDRMDGALDAATESRMDQHAAGCTECATLLADLVAIRAEAGRLPLLTPSRDLWDGIEARIEAPVVRLPGTEPSGDMMVVRAAPRRATLTRTARWQLAAAATLLVAATAGVTWSVAQRTSVGLAGPPAADSGFAAAMALTQNVRNASSPALNQTYEGEITALRKIVDERRADLDSTTAAILDRNLKVIDDAIAESKAALANNPASAFLLERLGDAYDTKLRTLRAIAGMPQRG